MHKVIFWKTGSKIVLIQATKKNKRHQHNTHHFPWLFSLQFVSLSVDLIRSQHPTYTYMHVNRALQQIKTTLNERTFNLPNILRTQKASLCVVFPFFVGFDVVVSSHKWCLFSFFFCSNRIFVHFYYDEVMMFSSLIFFLSISICLTCSLHSI